MHDVDLVNTKYNSDNYLSDLDFGYDEFINQSLKNKIKVGQNMKY